MDKKVIDKAKEKQVAKEKQLDDRTLINKENGKDTTKETGSREKGKG